MQGPLQPSHGAQAGLLPHGHTHIPCALGLQVLVCVCVKPCPRAGLLPGTNIRATPGLLLCSP